MDTVDNVYRGEPWEVDPQAKFRRGSTQPAEPATPVLSIAPPAAPSYGQPGLILDKVLDDCGQRRLIALEACDHRTQESLGIKLFKID